MTDYPIGDPCTHCFGEGKTYPDLPTPEFMHLTVEKVTLPAALGDCNGEHLLTQTDEPCHYHLSEFPFNYDLILRELWNMPGGYDEGWAWRLLDTYGLYPGEKIFMPSDNEHLDTKYEKLILEDDEYNYTLANTRGPVNVLTEIGEWVSRLYIHNFDVDHPCFLDERPMCLLNFLNRIMYRGNAIAVFDV